MTEPQRKKIDFTPMYAVHDAMRRDLVRLDTAAAAGKADTPQVLAGWQNFKFQLLLHHTVEDDHLWPRLEGAVAGRRADDKALLDAMEAEHARIDPLLTAVDEGIERHETDLAERVRELTASLSHHLRHEEESALPLIDDVLPYSDWQAFSAAMRRKQGMRGAATWTPWVLDDRPPEKQREILALLPAPIRRVNRMTWEPRYRRRNLWVF